MNTWHVKVNLEFEIDCDEDELSYMIREAAANAVEEMDMWDDDVVEFAKVSE